MKITPVLPDYLDGFGYREDTDHNAYAPGAQANLTACGADYPHT